MFAKIFNSEEFGQILITKETTTNPDYDGRCPSIQVRASLQGVEVSPNISWEPSGEGFDSREKFFEAFTLEDAESVIAGLIEEILNAAGGDDA